MANEFGRKVFSQAQALIQQGRDANQTAKILFDKDPEGRNYGIGISLGGDGEPLPTAKTLLEYTAAELENSGSGTYLNSNALADRLKAAVLKWQRIPQEHESNFILGLPSDAGTGAVKTAVELALVANPDLTTLGIEELGWPAYRTIAKASRLGTQEFSDQDPIAGKQVQPLYQAGPMNTTGAVKDLATIAARAEQAAKLNQVLILDRAYAGFEFATSLGDMSFDEIMRSSYEGQIRPFIDKGVTFCLALSPTKALSSFALRPCGLLLVYCPDERRRKELTTGLNNVLRARGSSFEHLTTRALVKAFVNDLERLEGEHRQVLERLSESAARWRAHARGTAIEYLFSDDYAGLFRNPKAKEGAPETIYGAHLYPVFDGGRCRINVTGIPADDEQARKDVQAFAAQCL